jgi:methionyl-tRNA synthetase
MYEHGKLERLSTKQFFDENAGVFLNGRQLTGRCPVACCNSEKAYADECDLGHSFLPKDLINPVSSLTGETPVMREVTNLYYKLPEDMDVLKEYVNASRKTARAVVTKTVSEFLEPPVIYIMNDYRAGYEAVRESLPPFEEITDPKKTSFTIKFSKLTDREAAEEVLVSKNIRFRTGKTLVPFRLTGNTEWGVPAPILEEGDEPSTVYVWPESLWAPISFTKAYLETIGAPSDEWKKYWCKTDAKIFQFIGQDNIYFYSVAEPGMFTAYNSADAHLPEDGELQIPEFAANHHILFLDKKASSSGNIKPPLADELLDYYTVDQLRMHFISLGLAMRSVSFQPKPFNPSAAETDSDPVTKEGFLLNNVLNRICRTALYEVQKCCGGIYPVGEVSPEVMNEAEQAILQYERFMHRLEFHQVSYVLDSFIRFLSKVQSKGKTVSDKTEDGGGSGAGGTDIRRQWLIDTLYGIRVSLSLLHPIVPESCELVREYFRLPDTIYNWDNIFGQLTDIYDGDFTPVFLEPRFDFFKKHPSQL